MRVGALILLILSFNLLAGQLTITTAPWKPYVKNDNSGSAIELLNQVYSQNNTQINWLIQNYDLAFMQVANKQKVASFPYFKTQKRAEQVLYSNAVFTVTSYVYFNRQFNQQISTKELQNFNIGKVAGYSYGEVIDALLNEAVVYNNEQNALTALLSGEIEYLPMTESVMNHLLNTRFSPRKLLVKPLKSIKDTASLHLIASKSLQGEAIINELNQLLEKVSDLASLKPATEPLKQSPDIGKLIVSEGYPVILGQMDLSQEPSFYTLAPGTKVLVIKWSEKMLKPANTDRIYQTMMDLSQVVILNGPLVGKELYVRNMHIELI